MCRIHIYDGISVEEIQNQVEIALMAERYYAVAKSFMLYRQKHIEDREVRDKLKFLIDYCDASMPPPAVSMMQTPMWKIKIWRHSLANYLNQTL